MSRANFVQVQLAQAATDIQTTLSVKAPVGGFKLPPADGGRLVLTDSLGQPSAFEVITYTGRTGSGPYTLTGVVRGVEGTVGLAWGVDTFVLQALTVGDLQELMDSKLGVGATAVAATKLATARTIGGVSFDGTVNINLPGVNTAGNQNTSGNAATATKLAAARTINGVAFDGSADITVVDATKEPAIPAGTTAQYVAGNKTLRTFAADVRAAVLTGLSTATNSAIAAADTLLAAIGKLQAQITGLSTSKLDANANAVSASKLATARNIAITGAADGSAAFDGSGDVSIVTTTPRVSLTTDPTSTFRAAVFGGMDNKIKVVRGDVSEYLNFPLYSPCLAWSTDDTHAFFSPTYSSPRIRVGAGAGTGISWEKDLAFTDSNITGNAATATKLQTARTITLTGDVDGSVSFDGSSNVTINAQVANDSHTHSLGNLGLGNAATATVQTSPTDNTAGRLMAVGAGGWLGSANPDSYMSGYPQSAGNNISQIYRRETSDAEVIAYAASIHFAAADTWGRLRLSPDTPKAWIQGGAHSTGRGWTAELFHSRNILGTVSQYGGVPTGAIIERGSNANGEYVRFVDGTQIVSCAITSAFSMSAYGTTGLFRGSFDITWPVSFASPPAVSGEGVDSFTVGLVSAFSTWSGCDVNYFSTSSTFTATDIRVIAIGRWY